jgi:hypothetical protein
VCGTAFDAEIIFNPSSVGLAPDTFSRKGRRAYAKGMTLRGRIC